MHRLQSLALLAVAMMQSPALLLPVPRELRMLRRCSVQEENAVQEQQAAVRPLLKDGLLRRLRALRAPHLPQVRRLQVRAQ